MPEDTVRAMRSVYESGLRNHRINDVVKFAHFISARDLPKSFTDNATNTHMYVYDAEDHGREREGGGGRTDLCPAKSERL